MIKDKKSTQEIIDAFCEKYNEVLDLDDITGLNNLWMQGYTGPDYCEYITITRYQGGGFTLTRRVLVLNSFINKIKYQSGVITGYARPIEVCVIKKNSGIELLNLTTGRVTSGVDGIHLRLKSVWKL